MAIKPKDIYRGRQKTHRTAKTITCLLLAVLVLAIALFLGLRQFAVYDEYGNATIVLPFSQTAED